MVRNLVSLILIGLSFHLNGQVLNLGCKSVADLIDIDRKDFTCDVTQKSQAWMHDFPIGPAPEPCKVITGVEVTISFTGDASAVTPPQCWFDWFTNIYVDCTGFGICDCSDLPPENLFGAFGDPTGFYPLANTGAIDWGDVISVDIVAVVNMTNIGDGCPIYQTAIIDGIITGSYSICVDIIYADDLISTPVDLGPDFDICFGDTGDLDATDPAYTNYLWSTGSTNPAITGLVGGSYEVTVTDAAGCTDTDEVTITDNPMIDVSFDQTDPFSICDGDTETITATSTGGAGFGYSYIWVTPGGSVLTSPTINTDDPGLYNLTVTDGASCTQTASIQMDVFPIPSASISAPNGDVICVGTPLDLESVPSGGTPNYTYQWTGPSFSSTDPNIIITNGGLYTLIVTDANGCESMSTDITISELIPPNAGTDNFDDICNDQTAINLESYLGTFDSGGIWTDLSGTGIDVSDPTNVMLLGLPGGTYQFSYTVFTSLPCVDDVAFVDINLIEASNAGTDANFAACTSEMILNFMDIIGPADPSGFWTPISANSQGLDISDPFNVDISNWDSGNYIFQYQVNGFFPCANAIAFLTLDIENAPNAGESNGLDNQVCAGSILNLLDYFISPPDPNGFWTDLDGAGVDLTNPNAVDFGGVPNGVYNFEYSINGILCSGFESEIITIQVDNIAAGISPDSTLCSTTIVVNLNEYILGSNGGVFLFENGDTVMMGLLDTIYLANDSLEIEYIVGEGTNCPISRDTFNFVIDEDQIASPSSIEQDLCDDNTFEVQVGADIYNVANPSGSTLLQTVDGCDSLVTVDLRFNNSSPTTRVEELRCQGDGFEIMIGSSLFNESNPTGVINLTNTGGCDSIIEVNLIYLASIESDIIENRCAGDNFSVTVGTEVFDEGNPVGSVTLTSVNNCDSIVNVNLNFASSVQSSINTQHCVGDGFSVVVGTTVYDESNPTGSELLQSINGCDSIVDINLVFTSSINAQIVENRCANDGFSIQVGTETFDESNPIGQVMLTSVSGCDSIVDVLLTFNASFEELIEENRCSNDGFSIQVGNETFNELNPSGQVILSSVAGCDSIVNINLLYSNSVNETLQSSQCEGNGFSIIVGTEIFDESNPSGSVTLQTVAGCDSIVTVELQFNSAVQQDLIQSECSGSGFTLDVGTMTFDENNNSGTVTLLSSTGCDSIINVQLTFNDVSINDIMESRCQGDNFELQVGTDIYSESNPLGQTVLSGVNAQGCDSIVNVMLDYTGIITMETVNLEFCETSGFQLQLGSDTYDINNPTGTTVLTSSTNCDSIISVNLAFNRPIDSSLFISICDNESIIVGSETIDANNTPNMVMLASATQEECDTIINLDIQLNSTSNEFLDLSLCTGDSIFIDNAWVFDSGLFIESFLSNSGCDSIINYDINFTPCQVSFDINGQSVSCFGFSDGQIELILLDGIDFPYTIQLIQNGIAVQNMTVESNNSINLFSNLSAGTYDITIVDGAQNILGNTTIDINEPLELEIVAQSNVGTLCFGATDASITIDITGGIPGYLLNNEPFNNNTIENLSAGNYSFIAEDSNGCTSSVDINLEQYDEITFDLNVVQESCDQVSQVTVNNISGGTGSYQVSLDQGGLQDQLVFESISAGPHTINIQDDAGCTSSISGFTLDVYEPSTTILPESITLIDEQTETLDLGLDFVPQSISWSPSSGLSCDDCPNPVANPDSTTTYTVTIIDDLGCELIQSILVRKISTFRVYIPDAFSPNSDEINDFFEIGTKDPVVLNVYIYDRWGNLVFECENCSSDEETYKWDGNFGDTSMNPGVFVYRMEITDAQGETHSRKGNITLIK